MNQYQITGCNMTCVWNWCIHWLALFEKWNARMSPWRKLVNLFYLNNFHF